MKNSSEQILQMLSTQQLGILSTFNPDIEQPYGSLIAFSYSADLKEIFFATPKATRKYANIKKCPKVSLLIDTRKNDGADIGVSAAVTVLGTANEIDRKTGQSCRDFLRRHAQLESFVHAPSTAFFCIKVEKYILVNRFQDVTELKIKQDANVENI